MISLVFFFCLFYFVLFTSLLWFSYIATAIIEGVLVPIGKFQNDGDDKDEVYDQPNSPALCLELFFLLLSLDTSVSYGCCCCSRYSNDDDV